VESDPELWEAFHQECSDLLEVIQKETLSLEESGQPKEVLESLMRQHHTLKGAANSVGLAPTARLLHRIEDFLEGLLNAPILPSMREVVDLLLDVQKEIRSHLRTASEGFVEHGLGHLKTRVAQVLAARRLSGSTVSTPSLPCSSDKSSSQSATGSSIGEQVSSMEIAEKRTIRVLAERLDSLMNLAGELVVSRSRLSSRVGLLRTMQQELGLAQRRLLECVEGFRRTYEFANLDGKSSTSLATEKPVSVSRRADWSKFSELELDRYDDIHVLSRSIGEISADLDEIAGNLFQEMAGLADDADSFGSIVSGIQNEVTRARMVPVEKLFSRLLLPVRDASALEHKEAHVVTAGEEVNLDKTIADALFQPMLHLVRNAVVHGVESPSARETSGKTRYGTITLGARQESGQIVLEIRDDGRGLDLAALHSRGVSLGHIPPETPLNDPLVKNLVFVPSLSTAASLKMVSGRGLGCDVVRRAVERLNGSIRVDSIGGQGTVFTIILPLTLAITRALMVQHASRVYAIPLFFAEHIFDLEQAQVVESAGSVRMKIDEHFMPVHPISSVLSSSNKTSDCGPVIVLRMGEQRLAVQVDSVLAQEEIVVKGLGEILQGHPVFAGATIRGNGELALIIDVPGIIETIVGVRSPSLDLMGEPEAAKIDKEPRLSSASRQPATSSSKKKSPPPKKAAKDAVPVQPHTSDNGPKPPKAVPQQTSPASLMVEVAAQDVLVSSTAAAKKTRVLFVDDSLSVRKVAEKALLSLGVQVTVAVDGLDALEKLRNQSFDIVFTDLEMPRMHGFEFLRELRFLPAWRSLPVVVVSSRSGQKHQDQARALGANDYLTKPFDAQSLNNAIKRWVSLQTTRNSDSTDSKPGVEK
jgi:chemosensory pili system protein ChpA (sensor histidine kinase/response regulator)